MGAAETEHGTPMIQHTVKVVASYLSNNSIDLADVPKIISVVHKALLVIDPAVGDAAAARPAPPVPVRKSVFDDYLVSLEDGRRYRSLKRHLSGRGLTPEQYRQKWNLAHDYPMVAPNYAKLRSELAKSMGLGRSTAEAARAARSAARRRAAGG